MKKNINYTGSKFQAKKIDKNRYELDVRGLACPFPQLIVIKTLNDIPIGDVLEVIVDNPPSIREIPPVLEKKGHKVADISSIDRTTWKMVVHNKVELALKDKILLLLMYPTAAWKLSGISLSANRSKKSIWFCIMF